MDNKTMQELARRREMEEARTMQEQASKMGMEELDRPLSESRAFTFTVRVL